MYISQISQHWIWGITERFINEGSVIWKLNLDDIPLVRIIWLSWLDSLGVRGVRIFFYCLHVSSQSQPYHRLRPYRLCHEYDEYTGRRSLLISGSFMQYILRRDVSPFGYKVLRARRPPDPRITFHPPPEWMDPGYKWN